VNTVMNLRVLAPRSWLQCNAYFCVFSVRRILAFKQHGQIRCQARLEEVKTDVVYSVKFASLCLQNEAEMQEVKLWPNGL
jgi:hypothetical protein